MRHGSLFSGIGGFDLAAQWMGWENVFHCEIDEWNRRLLKQHWPESETFDDITKSDFTKYANKVDILSGGFPCQDISIAGNGGGIFGSRSGLWSEYKRVIKETNPKYIVAENSPELFKKGFEVILCDLSEIGYVCEWECIPALYVGASHERERAWVVAYPDRHGFQGILQRLSEGGCLLPKPSDKIVIYSLPQSFEQLGDYKRIREYDGIPDQSHRVKGCGNAIVPGIAYEIFKAIEAFETTTSCNATGV